jgi:hypothetical protein
MREGTFHESLQDYLKSIDLPQRRLLSQFIGCSEQAVGRWAKRTNLPVGESALRLFHLMEAVGFQITDWKVKNTDVLTVGRCLTFHVLTAEQVAWRLTGQNMDGVIAVQMLIGNRHIKPENLQGFAMLASEYGPLLSPAKAKWQNLMFLDEKIKTINELANRLKELLPLAEDLASDNYSGQERHELRKLCGEATVFRLYNLFGALCGERARAHVNSAGLILRKD